MRVLTIIVTCLLTLGLSSCSIDDVKGKINSYSTMTPEEATIQLLNDGNHVGTVGKKIAWCQAKAITKSGLPEAVINAVLKDDGRTVVERAKSLDRPGLARKLKRCVTVNVG